MAKTKVIGIIPARYASSRYPGKPLIDILGKSLILRTYQQASKAKHLSEIIVATDDKRIFDHVKDFGGTVMMTSPDHLTGTDRVAEVASHFSGADAVVNIQGDEPLLDPSVIDTIIENLQDNPDAAMTTAATPLTDLSRIASPNTVKVVLGMRGEALYFSRSTLPFARGKPSYLRHIGIYAFRRDFLLKLGTLSPTPLQIAEDLEPLKVLEHGYKIYVSVVDDVGIGVDTPEDKLKVEEILCKENSYSSQAESSPHLVRA